MVALEEIRLPDRQRIDRAQIDGEIVLVRQRAIAARGK
jgi:hypothetical protein